MFCSSIVAADRPNILWFVADDMSANFSCYGEKTIETPQVDRLAREGTKFANAFVTAPVCSPCRSALITGMYQTSIGAHHHRSGRGVEKILLPDGVEPIPVLFQRAGYYTCIGSDLIEHIDLATLSLAAAGIPLPKAMHGRNVLARDYTPREAVIAARDRCDETVERIRSVRTDRFLYIRNFYSQRPHLQPNAYKDGKSIVQTLRGLHAAGTLDSLAEALLFSPTRPEEELYEWTTDRWQVRNLASDLAHRPTLELLRGRLDRWMEETRDRGPESEKMYDSDMAVYVGQGNPVVEKDIALMKKWAAEGK